MSRYIDTEKIELKFIHGRFDDRYVSECEISKIPTADVVEVKHGKFRKSEIREGEWLHTCSECAATYGSEDGILYFNYCPNCGAKMECEGSEER